VELGSHTLYDLPANTLCLVDINLKIQIVGGNGGGTQAGSARVLLNGVQAEDKFIYTSVEANKWLLIPIAFNLSHKMYVAGDFTVSLEVMNATWTSQQINFETPQVRIVAIPTQ